MSSYRTLHSAAGSGYDASSLVRAACSLAAEPGGFDFSWKCEYNRGTQTVTIYNSRLFVYNVNVSKRNSLLEVWRVQFYF